MNWPAMNQPRFALVPPAAPRSVRSLLVASALFVIAVQPAVADPGELFQKRRQAIVAKFDQNKDGRLDATEREAVRATKRDEARRGAGRGSMFQMPPEIVEMYDRDKDGHLDEAESAAANDGIRIRWGEAQKEYDANGDGNLDDGEREKMGDAIAAGRVKGLPRMFGAMMRRPPGGGRGGGGGMFGGGGVEESPLTKFDTDKDGRLSEAELAIARKAGAGKQSPR
jgi:hypothetical protein